MAKNFFRISVLAALGAAALGCASSAPRNSGDAGAAADAAPSADATLGDDPCTTSTSCDACTVRAGCGFCSDDGVCRTGTSTGPNVGTCGADAWAWLPSECGGACVPSCTGAACGDDGCGGSCGTCRRGLACGADRTCSAPPTATWSVSATSATIEEHNDAGGTWDAFGGAPDPILCVTLGATRTCAPTVSDTLMPTWSPAYTFGTATTTALQSGVAWSLTDDDVDADDEICSGTFAPSDAELGAGTLRLTCEFATVELRFRAM